jgi:hypothetical protein
VAASSALLMVCFGGVDVTRILREVWVYGWVATALGGGASFFRAVCVCKGSTAVSKVTC